jgi:hypothetical protein
MTFTGIYIKYSPDELKVTQTIILFSSVFPPVFASQRRCEQYGGMGGRIACGDVTVYRNEIAGKHRVKCASSSAIQIAELRKSFEKERVRGC